MAYYYMFLQFVTYSYNFLHISVAFLGYNYRANIENHSNISIETYYAILCLDPNEPKLTLLDCRSTGRGPKGRKATRERSPVPGRDSDGKANGNRSRERFHCSVAMTAPVVFLFFVFLVFCLVKNILPNTRLQAAIKWGLCRLNKSGLRTFEP